MTDDLCINTLKRAGFSECAAYIEGRLREADELAKILSEIQTLRDQIRNLDTRDGK